VTERTISGEFEVTLTPQSTDADPHGSTLARLAIDKQFRGALEARSKGEMLSAATQTKGSAGYVAIERVTGALEGREGTFVLQHTGVMDRGAPSLTITVVPDSGTGALAGLVGTMTIDITGGKHHYAMTYTLLA
jgi:hypothetical protein